MGTAGQVVIQEHPTGMADAVRLAGPSVRTDCALVVWGDQVTLRPETISACAALHERRATATLTLATVMKADPYIDIERDAEDRIVRVRQAREGEVERPIGENDCGLFLFSTKALFATLDAALEQAKGARTGEANLLPLLPAFEQGRGSVATVRLDDPDETLGVNTPAEAAAVARILAARRRHAGA
jgi:bifunctional N-acetylglucosamine-1-phosphate-uridyltransferase/glucosamine-1-phosphate-acetyltransferase GlmU-like protein